MPHLADAHAHFFAPGYVDTLPESCRRVQPDELTLYRAYMERHAIAHVLAVGYEGASWAAGNNSFIAQLGQKHTYVHPLAFIANPARMTLPALEQLDQEGFIGVSFYLFDQAEHALAGVDNGVWRWLDDRSWLVSVNSSGQTWLDWIPVLEQHPDIRLLISHLGLPPAHATPPSDAQATEQLAAVMRLAAYPSVHIKVSGLYALTEPCYDYPHRAVWPYINVLAEGYGIERLLWGSDFSPALEHVSFDQTVGAIDALPNLGAEDKDAIWGGNLSRLLEPLIERKHAS